VGLFADFTPLGDFLSGDFATLPELGPPYPPAPQTPLQPSLGTFIPGDVVPFSYWDTIISQYANSRIITGLIGNFQQYIDQGTNMESLYDNIWNVLTAQGYGLDVWGRIVGIQRVVAIQTAKFFGFEEQTPATVEPFGPGGVGCFYSGVPASSSYALSDQSFRALILAKAMSNISSCSVPSINAILRSLFPGRGNCYATDGYNMTMTYTFSFPITHVEYSIISASGVLPKPTGVTSSIVFPGYM
jgi:hypothetical protein